MAALLTDELVNYEPTREELEKLEAFDDDCSDEDLDAAEGRLVEKRIGELRMLRSTVRLNLGEAWVRCEEAVRAARANGVGTFPVEYQEAEAAIERAYDACRRVDDAWQAVLEDGADLDHDVLDVYPVALESAETALRAAVSAFQRATQLATRAKSTARRCVTPRTSRRTGSRARAARPVRRTARTVGSRGDPSRPGDDEPDLAAAAALGWLAAIKAGDG